MTTFSNIFPNKSTGKLIQKFIGQYESISDLPDAANYEDGTTALVQSVGFFEVSAGAWVVSTATAAELDQLGDVDLQNLEEFHTLVYDGTSFVNDYPRTAKRVRNQSGATIPAGTLVEIVNSTASFALIGVADRTTSTAVSGITLVDIPNNSLGTMQIDGTYEGVNTNGLTPGTPLWLDTAGGFTTTLPTTGAVIRVGEVGIAATSSGTIILDLPAFEAEAEATAYDNTASGLTGDTVQAAVDEVYAEKGTAGGLASLDGSGHVVQGSSNFVTSLAALKALTAGQYQRVRLDAGGRSGLFVWDASDLSTEVTNDPEQGVYVPPNADATGASGAWVREFDGRTVNVQWFGAIGDDSTDCTVALQATIDFIQGQPGLDHPHGLMIVPPGVYWISDPIGFNETSDYRTGMEIRGAGRRVTTIEQRDGTKPVFQLRNTTRNIRDFVMRDIRLFTGTRSIELENNYYNYFENITFMGYSEAGIWGRGASDKPVTEFAHCWWVHDNGDLCVDLERASLRLSNCVFGEDVGGFKINGSELEIRDSIFIKPYDKGNVDNYGEGNSLFRVVGGADLSLLDCQLWLTNDLLDTMVFTSTQRSVHIMGCRIKLRPGATLIANRLADAGTAPHSPQMVVNNDIIWQGGASPVVNHFYRALVGTDVTQWKNSIIQSNTIQYLESDSVEIDDALFHEYQANIVRDIRFRAYAVGDL